MSFTTKITNMKKKKSLTKDELPPLDEDLGFDFEEEDDIGFDFDEETPVEEEFQLESPESKTSRGGAQAVTVTVRPGQQFNVSDLILEAITTRRIIPEDWDLDKCSSYLNTVGSLRFCDLAVDEDRYHKALYAAEYLRKLGRDENPFEPTKYFYKHLALRVPSNPNHDTSVHQEKLDGRTVGDASLAMKMLPVREQVQEKQEQHIEDNRIMAVPTEHQKDRETDPMLAKWQEAERIARTTKRSDWEGNLDFEMEAMVKHCYIWLKDIGSVDYKPDKLMDIFWPRSQYLGESTEVQERRYAMTGRILDFFKSNLPKFPNINLTSNSYRTVLAAKALSKALDAYAKNVDPSAEAQCTGQVKEKSKEYFMAHIPIASEIPGPNDTIEPNYVDYLRLCRKFGYPEGTPLAQLT